MFIINNVTEAQFSSLDEQLTKNNTVVMLSPGYPDTYTIQGHNIVAIAIFDKVKSTLAVTINRKPFFITESMIQDGIVSALGATK